MSVESSASNIGQLNINWPLAEDFISEGDDHIRIIKKTLKQTFPNIKNGVSISDAQLNNIGSAFKNEAESNKITVLDNLVVNKDGNCEGGKTSFTLGEITDKTLINFKMLQALAHPVGSLVFLPNGANPREVYGFGSWEPFGQGRVIIGAGTTTDSRGESRSFTNGVTGGEFMHVLTTPEMPLHTHGSGSLSTTVAGGHSHQTDWPLVGEDGAGSGSIASGGWGGAEDIFRQPTKTSGEHSHQITGESANNGGSQPHNITQPYIVVNTWRRTA